MTAHNTRELNTVTCKNTEYKQVDIKAVTELTRHLLYSAGHTLLHVLLCCFWNTGMQIKITGATLWQHCSVQCYKAKPV